MKGRIPGAIVVVATVAATFGVFMLQAVALLLALIGSSDAGSRARAQPMLTTVAWIFIGVAVYVSGVVTTNTVSTVITGRTRTIALLRLLGSSARTERKRIAVEGLIAGAIGGVGGLVLGTVAVLVLQQVGVGQHWWTDSLRPNYADPGVITPVLVIIGAIWLASWVGSHRVLAVRPTEALTQSVEVDQTVIRHRWVRHVIAMVLVVVGLVLLVVGVFMGRTDPRGVLPAFFGGVICFTGIVMLAPLVMPRVLRVVGCAFGGGAAAKLAAENAVRYPERSSRMTVGLLIGVTLVMTFAVAMTTYRDVLLRILPPDDAGEVIRATSQVVNITITVFSVLIGVSAIIAAIGLVNILSLTVGQRRREIALLRAIGFSRAQVRRMILAESGALVAGGTVLGLILGTGFGWAGGLALTGSLTSERRSMHDVGPIFVWPSMPWALCALIVLAAVVLTLAAAALPIRRAVATTPVEALQVT